MFYFKNAPYVINSEEEWVQLGRVISFKKDLKAAQCQVTDINWIVAPPKEPLKVSVRLRYRHSAVSATVTPLNNQCAAVRFDTLQEAVTPGQGAVFYQKNEVLGGGWIE